jgi:hypothetical protein
MVENPCSRKVLIGIAGIRLPPGQAVQGCRPAGVALQFGGARVAPLGKRGRALTSKRGGLGERGVTASRSR